MPRPRTPLPRRPAPRRNTTRRAALRRAAARRAVAAALFAAGPAAALAAPPAALDAVPEGRLKAALAAELAILDARRDPAEPAAEKKDAAAVPAARPSAGTTAPAPQPGLLTDPPGWVDPFGGEEAEVAEDPAAAAADLALDLALDLSFAPPSDPAARPTAGVAAVDLPDPAGTAGPKVLAAAGGTAEEPAAPEPLTAGPSAPVPPAAAPAGEPGGESAGDEIERLALTPGFGRYCPVAVRDDAALVDADPAVHLDRDGVRWHFASAAARTAFAVDPDRYLPAVGGQDVVLRSEEGFRSVGRAELAVLYRGRLFLFRSAVTRAAFADDPLRFVVAE